MKNLFPLLIAMTCLFSCKTHVNTVSHTEEEYIHLQECYDSISHRLIVIQQETDSIVNEFSKADSVYREHRDSTIIYMKGDTVYRDRFVTDVVYRESKVTEDKSHIQSHSDLIAESKDSIHARIDTIYKNVDHTQTITESKEKIPLWFIFAFIAVTGMAILGWAIVVKSFIKF